MVAEHSWLRSERFYSFHPELELSLDLSRMDLPKDFLERLEGPLQKALDDMEALEGGAVANPDEGRMVGHYWLRAPELAPDKAITDQIVRAQKQVTDFAAQIHYGSLLSGTQKTFKNVLMMGIGGSALGPQLLRETLVSHQDKMKLTLMDNTDPDGFHRVLRSLRQELDRTLCVVVSKSGGTVETRNAMLETQRAFSRSRLSFAKHAVAVTCPQSSLDEMARELGWLDVFPIWEWVGGRTSLFSSVGLLPAALMGWDAESLLHGAGRMDRATRNRVLTENPAALLAAAWHVAVAERGLKEMVVLPYKDRMALWTRYLQQLVMESLGKETDLEGKEVHSGIAVYGNKGSTDQHALVQQLRDGPSGFFVTFVHVLRDICAATRGSGAQRDVGAAVDQDIKSGDCLLAMMLGTRQALHERGRPSLTITLERLEALSLAELVAVHERAVGIFASMNRINAYHQPGVEAGKKVANATLELQRRSVEVLREAQPRPMTVSQVAEAAGVKGQEESLYYVLRHLTANENRGVRRHGMKNPEEELFWWEKGPRSQS